MKPNTSTTIDEQSRMHCYCCHTWDGNITKRVGPGQTTYLLPTLQSGQGPSCLFATCASKYIQASTAEMLFGFFSLAERLKVFSE